MYGAGRKKSVCLLQEVVKRGRHHLPRPRHPYRRTDEFRGVMLQNTFYTFRVIKNLSFASSFSLQLLACFRDFPLEIPLAHCVLGGMVSTFV